MNTLIFRITYSSVVSGNASSYRNFRISTNSASSVSQLPFTEVYIGRKSSVSTYVCIMQFTYLFDRLSIPPPTNTLIIPNFKNEIPYFHPFLQISQIFSPFFLIIYPLFRFSLFFRFYPPKAGIRAHIIHVVPII
jgi:hypothetical protein